MTRDPSGQRLLAAIAVSMLVVACGGRSADAPPSMAAPKTSKAQGDSARPPPLVAPDKREAWKGPDATVFEIPSLGVLEVIASTEASGVDAEYKYLLTQHCSDGTGHWKTNEQSLISKGDRQYDVLSCTCSSTGESKDFTFDITQYFGADFH